MMIEYTRRIVDTIHDGSLLEAEYELTPIFNLAVPTKVKHVPTELLHPENSVSKVLTLFSKSMKMQLDVDLHWVL
jgi:phosphoenolpyruvate carboxykinase (ATP)